MKSVLLMFSPNDEKTPYKQGGYRTVCLVSSAVNGKRACTSHQGISRNGPWERLAWLQRTLERMNEKNETSVFGLWTKSLDVSLPPFHSGATIVHLKNSWRISVVSLAWSLLLRAKLSCKFTSMKKHFLPHENAGKSHFFQKKKCGSFSQELCGQGILSFRTS